MNRHFCFFLLLGTCLLPKISFATVDTVDLLDSAQRANNIVDYFHARIFEPYHPQLRFGEYLLYLDLDVVYDYPLLLEGGQEQNASLFMFKEVLFTPQIPLFDDMVRVGIFACMTQNSLAENASGFRNAFGLSDQAEDVVGLFFHDELLGLESRFADGAFMLGFGWLMNETYQPDEDGEVDLEHDSTVTNRERYFFTMGLPEHSLAVSTLYDAENQEIGMATLGMEDILGSLEDLGQLSAGMSYYRRLDMYSVQMSEESLFGFLDFASEINLLPFGVRSASIGTSHSPDSDDEGLIFAAGATLFHDARYQENLGRDADYAFGGYLKLGVRTGFDDRPFEIVVDGRYNNPETLRAVYEADGKFQTLIHIVWAFQPHNRR